MNLKKLAMWKWKASHPSHKAKLFITFWQFFLFSSSFLTFKPRVASLQLWVFLQAEGWYQNIDTNLFCLIFNLVKNLLTLNAL